MEFVHAATIWWAGATTVVAIRAAPESILKSEDVIMGMTWPVWIIPWTFFKLPTLIAKIFP